MALAGRIPRVRGDARPPRESIKLLTAIRALCMMSLWYLGIGGARCSFRFDKYRPTAMRIWNHHGNRGENPQARKSLATLIELTLKTP